MAREILAFCLMGACGFIARGRGFLARSFGVAGWVLAMSSASWSGEIVSNEFSVGVGAGSVTPPIWIVDETSQVSPGENFSLSVDLEGEAMSPTGPTFNNQRLGGVSGEGVVGKVDKFVATITGKYTGPAPADAANPPNYRIQVNIKDISIYAAAIGDASTTTASYTVNFNEVTSGQEQSQEPQTVELKPDSFSNPANYVPIVWTPKNAPSPVGALDQEQGRIFDLTESEPSALVIDGFEIKGTIVLLYDTKK